MEPQEDNTVKARMQTEPPNSKKTGAGNLLTHNTKDRWPHGTQMNGVQKHGQQGDDTTGIDESTGYRYVCKIQTRMQDTDRN